VFLVAEEAVNPSKLRSLVKHNPVRITMFAAELRIPVKSNFLVAEEAVNLSKLRPLVGHNPIWITVYATELRIPEESSVSCC
jgi:hypothetical protein